MSFSSATYNNAVSPPISHPKDAPASGFPQSLETLVAALQYHDMALNSDAQGAEGGYSSAPHAGKRRPTVGASESELEAGIRQERADAAAQAEQQLRLEFEQKLASARSEIAAAVEAFDAQRADYFVRVEAEVVQLSLSIAARILRREAQVDPMLVATLVRVVVEKMREDSSVTARVSAGCGAEWKRYFEARPSLPRVEVVEDPQVSDGDCVLETELGSAHFGLDAQLKEVERGFFDLLALRPVKK